MWAFVRKWWWLILLGLGTGVLFLGRLFAAAPGAAAKAVEAAKAAAAKAEEDGLLEKARNAADTAAKVGALEEVQKIPDGQLRRKRLAEMLDQQI